MVLLFVVSQSGCGAGGAQDPDGGHPGGPRADAARMDATLDDAVAPDGHARDARARDGTIRTDAVWPESDGATLPVDGSASSPDGGSADPCATGMFTLYLSPGGQNWQAGTSPGQALATLGGAQAVLQALDPACDVEVRVAQGVYSQPSTTTWTYYHPPYVVRFMPADYQVGMVWGQFAGRPVFDGGGHGGYWLWMRGGVDAPYGASRVELHYLHVRHYVAGGLALVGNKDDPAQWNGHNRVYGMFFEEIGDVYGTSGPGYAGVALVNSRQNEIRNNHFVHLENGAASLGLIHGLYIQHHSYDNLVEDNRFERVSGDPIRVRDDSNGNIIRSNDFSFCGTQGSFGDWYCDQSQTCTGAQNVCAVQECPSYLNEFRQNQINCGYDDTFLPLFYFYQVRDCVPPGCSDPGERLVTASNVNQCVP